MVYVKDPTDSVYHICDERDISVHDVIIRIGKDGGQGSLKLIMYIFEPSGVFYQEKKDSGVNKVIILAFVKDIQKSHNNMKVIFEKAKLNDLKFVLASYFKLLNIIVGLLAHGGRYACIYCKGTIDQEGEPRSISDLSENYQAYKSNGENPKTMKDFYNVINPCLLDENNAKTIIEIVPIPELHILMKVVTKLTELLCSNLDLKQWLKSKGIHWHGYNGGGLDGKNSNKVLKLLAELSQMIDEKYPEFDLVVTALEKFSKVTESCFGMVLDENFEEVITQFLTSVEVYII